VKLLATPIYQQKDMHDMEHSTLQHWVQQAQDGGTAGRAAFDQLAAHFGPAAVRWARLILADDHAAQDAAQEGLLQAYQHIAQLRQPSNFSAWLRQIVVHQAYRQLRTPDEPALNEDENSTPASPYADPAETLEAHDRNHRLRAALNSLPQGERAVAQLFYYDDYSQQEIAQRLQLPLTTVKKRLQYARERLRDRADTYGITAQLHYGTIMAGGFDSPHLRDQALAALLEMQLLALGFAESEVYA
jgi:RNA polymerase sigma factor (sigma-70 family)